MASLTASFGRNVNGIKTDKDNGELLGHPVASHSADVAACMEVILQDTLLGQRLARLCKQDKLTAVQQHLCVLAAFHDIGNVQPWISAQI